jgi:hypothetical protein
VNLWLTILPFLALVLVHHFLMEPLFHKKNKVWYGLLTLLLLVAFGLYCFLPDRRPDRRAGNMPWPPPDELPFDRQMGRPGLPPVDGRGPIRPEIQELIIGILLVAGDLGLTALYRSRKHEAELKELQAANVSRQLEALRYQINPHFFMNTLNNIQSLIYTDPDKATEAVSEFSKLMRIVLYEGEAPTIPLSHELDYIRHYLSLMRLRYPESVRIEAALPRETDSAVVPPLLMASFVENAFKHGISYEAPSFVRLSLEMTQRRILFSCANSLHPARQKEQHGLGMENIRKRLDLLYDSDYALHIDEQPDSYRVLLDIPLTPKNEQA